MSGNSDVDYKNAPDKYPACLCGTGSLDVGGAANDTASLATNDSGEAVERPKHALAWQDCGSVLRKVE
jgi:hypothetical protein